MRQIYAPPDHPVFLLVPQEFSQQASLFMVELGLPPVTGDNVWNVYADLLMRFQSIERDEGIRKLLAAQLPLPGDGDNLIGSEDLPIVDLPLFVEGSGPGSDMGIEKSSDEESDDAELDFYEFDWTDDELLWCTFRMFAGNVIEWLSPKEPSFTVTLTVDPTVTEPRVDVLWHAHL